MKKIGLVVVNIFFVSCVNICVPKCNKYNPCRTDVKSTQYELSSILDEKNNENQSVEGPY
jgi:hypothetical protein